MKKKRVILFIIFIWIPSILIARVLNILNCISLGMPALSPETVGLISERINVEPDWEAFRTYLKETIKPGMTRAEAIAVLNQIGPWRSGYNLHYKESGHDLLISQVPKLNEIIYFLDVGRPFLMGRVWSIEYEYGIVVSFGLMDS